MLLVKYVNHVSLDKFKNAVIWIIVLKLVCIATKIILPSRLEPKLHQNTWKLGETSNLANLLCKYGNPAIQTSLKKSVFNSSSSNVWV